MWELGVAASLGIAVPYFAIAYFVTRGLMRSGQLRTNRLGLATALIFYSCGTGHLLHAGHLLFEGERFRSAVDVHMTVWDLSTAAIACWYLSMRGRYGQLLQSPTMFEDQQRVAAEEKARYGASHDQLTGLANRQALMEAVEGALDEDAAPGERALLFLDLDGFKAVNDRFGHLAGDTLLVVAAKRLRGTIRPEDQLARLGGDEFVILLGETSTEADAIAVALRLTDALGSPFNVAGELLTLTASIGIALAMPGEAKAAELLHRADIAMYEAKNEDRGRYRVHGGDRARAFAASA